MTFNYASLQSTALNQITDKGRSVTLVYRTVGTYDPSTDAISGDSETETSVKALFKQFKFNQIDGSVVQRDDLICIVPASGVTKPTTKDRIKEGTTVYNIIDVKEVKPGDTVLLYELQLRK